MRLGRRDFLKTAGSGIAGAAFCGCALSPKRGLSRSSSRVPNIIVIFSDDQGYGDTSAGLHDRANYTPNLERLARRGITFTDGYAAASMCTPSRATLLSGRYHGRLGIYDVMGDAGMGFPPGEKIMPQYLKELGYATGCFGKWHVGGDIPGYEYNRPLNKGFDRFWGFYGSTHDYWKSEPGSGFNSTGYHGCGHQPIHDQEDIVQKIKYLTYEITDRSLEFIEENKDRPFFLYIPHHCSHVPLQVPKEIYNEYEDLHYGPNATITRAMYEAMDEGIGKILDRLEQLGIADNTLIFFSSDNGGGDVCAQLSWIYRGGKFDLLEGGIRVPLMISWPARLPQNRICGDPVMNIDFLPTMLAAIGAPQDPKFEGLNLLPYLRGQKEIPDRPLFWKMPPGKGDYAVRQGDWKLVYTSRGRGLFNLREDPRELEDLSKAYPARVAQMEELYRQWDLKNIPPVFTAEHRKEFMRMESTDRLDNESWQYSSTFGDESD